MIEFFKQFTAYHLMPTSAKVLTIDADTSVYRAFRIMGDNSVSSAYVWDKNTQMYISVLTATDIMRACVVFYKVFFGPSAVQDPAAFAEKYNIACPSGEMTMVEVLSHVFIRDLKQGSQLMLAHTNTSLYEAIDTMMEKQVHRLPIIDNDGSIVLSLTYRSICRFLVSKFKFNSQVLEKSIQNSGVINSDFQTAKKSDSLFQVI